MSFGRRFRRLIGLPTRSGTVIDRDLDDEVTFHIEMRVQDLVKRGVPHDVARQQARTEFGDARRLKESLGRADRSAQRERRLARWFSDFSYDLRFAMRQIIRSPLFAAISILTVSIGIGSNTAIMSAVRGIVLRPLPFHEPDRLIRLYSRHERLGPTAVSVPDFVDIRAQATSFTGMAAWYSSTTNMSGEGAPERLESARVSDNWFELLGTQALSGRTFASGEDRHGEPIRAVISDDFWTRRFARDRSVIGRTLRLDGNPVEIIGIVPGARAFPPDVDVWMTTMFSPEDLATSARGARWLRVMARLKPGVTLSQANDDVARVAKLIEAQDPRHNTGYSAFARTFQESIIGDYRRPLFVLLGAVGLVMLVVCTNVAGLMVARTAARETEIAVRAAIGAGRGRIVRQLVTEALVLALAGGALGFLLGVAGTQLLVRFAPPDIPRLDDVGIDGVVFAFTFALAVISGVAFGLVPALQASRHDVRSRLQAQSRGAAGRFGSVRIRRALVVSELAIAIVLLVCAGLLLRSFAKLQRVDPGFRATGLQAFTVTLPEMRYPRLVDQRQFLDRTLEGLRVIPGVEHAAASFGLPLTSTRFQLTFTIDGNEGEPNNEPRGQVRVASPEYFKAMGIPLLKGRVFTTQDRWDTQPVVVVSDSLARRFFPNGDAIGRVIETGWKREGHALGGEIVGIVGDVKQFGLSTEAPPAYYAAADQWPTDEITFVVSGSGSADGTIPGLRAVIQKLDPELPIFDVTSGESLVAASLAQPRFYLMVIAAFATAALLLAAIGVYGIIAYTVRQRTREIGVRMALGASAAQIVRMVVGEGVVLAAVGSALGVAVALALAGQITELLYDVAGRDWITLVSVTAVLLMAAIIACAMPARSAARLGPQEALRSGD
jgi:putative ABC transport system permease protein